VGVAIEIVALSRSQPEWHGFSRSWSDFFQLWQWDDSHDIGLSSSVLGNINNMGLAVGILPPSCSHPELQGFSISGPGVDLASLHTSKSSTTLN
jgi:hypothetical protein